MSSLGDFKRARQWLALAGEHGPFPAMRTWVDIGIAYRGGEWERFHGVARRLAGGGPTLQLMP
jgi:hypothetical protein